MALTRRQKLVVLSASFLALTVVVIPQVARTQVYIPVPPVRDHYGAIAFSQSEGSLGSSRNFSSRLAAEEASLISCSQNGVKGCFVVAWFRNTCGALATDSKRVFGFGYDRDARVARANSVEECRKAGGTDCEARRVTCSSNRQ